MRLADCVVSTLNSSWFPVEQFLKDLTDEELLVRPVPGANHIAWQLGHLILAETHLVDCCAPGAMQPLPDGWREKFGRESTATSSSDDPTQFLNKAEYLDLMQRTRGQTLEAVRNLPESRFDERVENVPPFLRTVGDCLLFIGPHWLMHAGQWTVIRRKLGRAPLF